MNEYLVSFFVVLPLLVAILGPLMYVFKDFMNEFLGEYDDDTKEE